MTLYLPCRLHWQCNSQHVLVCRGIIPRRSPPSPDCGFQTWPHLWPGSRGSSGCPFSTPPSFPPFLPPPSFLLPPPFFPPLSPPSTFPCFSLFSPHIVDFCPAKAPQRHLWTVSVCGRVLWWLVCVCELSTVPRASTWQNPLGHSRATWAKPHTAAWQPSEHSHLNATMATTMPMVSVGGGLTGVMSMQWHMVLITKLTANQLFFNSNFLFGRRGSEAFSLPGSLGFGRVFWTMLNLPEWLTLF